MSRSSSLIIFGILVVLAPFSGLPSSWLAVLLPLFGIVVALVGLSLRLAEIKTSKTVAPSPEIAPETFSAPSGPSISSIA